MGVKPSYSRVNDLLKFLRGLFYCHEIGQQTCRLTPADGRKFVRTALCGHESQRIVLSTPGSRDSIVIHLTLDDYFKTVLKGTLAMLARRFVSDVLKVTLIGSNFLKQTHHIGHQIVVERDVVLIASVSRKRVILRPTTTALLGHENHIQGLLERIFIPLQRVLLPHFGQKAHLLGGSTIIQTRVFVTGIVKRILLSVSQFVQLVVFHPTTTYFLDIHHHLGYLHSLFTAIPFSAHFAVTDVRPFHVRGLLRTHHCHCSQEKHHQ